MKIKIFAGEITQEVKDNPSSFFTSCEVINKQNFFINGGTLRAPFYWVLNSSDALIVAVDSVRNWAVGYVAIKKMPDRKIYVNQAAVIKQLQRKKIASIMYMILENFSQEFDIITTNIHPSDKKAIALHKSLGFTENENPQKDNVEFSKDINKENIFGTFDDFYQMVVEVEIEGPSPILGQ